MNGFLVAAAFLAFLGIFFDFFDGLLARKLNAQSELGLQLDSLADLVTSGLVPGVVMLQLISLAKGSSNFLTEKNEWEIFVQWTGFRIQLLALLGLLITLASAYRLANFNIDENQTDSFIGLPTPANTLLILSFPLIMEFQGSDTMNAIILNKWVLIGVTLVSCFLLNAKIKLLALKFKNWSFKDNASRYILLIMAVVLLVVFKFAAIPLIIIFYIFISLLNK